MIRFSATLFCFFSQFSSIHGYGTRHIGACRGPGGEHDKVNSRSVGGIQTEAECESECTALGACVGYSYCETCNDGECILYGPGVDGTCSNPIATNQVACEALGSCDDSTKTTFETCGFCKEPTGETEVICNIVGSSWTPGVWTSANEVWSDAEDPWSGDSHFSTVIAGSTGENSSTYVCVDADDEDHKAHCTGNSTCTEIFANVTDDARTDDNCPDGCTFVPAPTLPRASIPHSGDIGLPGWNAAMSGACRGGVNQTDKVNGKYSNEAGADGRLTQEECANACLEEDSCIGYAHSTAWCVVYGPLIHETPGDLWESDNHDAVEITGTKPNPAYICVTRPTTTSADITSDGSPTTPTTPSSSAISSGDSPTDSSTSAPSSSAPGMKIGFYMALVTAFFSTIIVMV